MRRWKWIKRVVVGLVLAVLVAGGTLYYAISRVPEGYGLLALSQAQKKRAAQEFVSKAVTSLLNPAPGEVLRWVSTEDELNRYLASMDEIAHYRLGGKRGQVYRRLERARLSGLVVRLGEGRITFMFRSDEYGKIVSVDFSLAVTEDKKLLARLKGVRIGRLAIPETTVRRRMMALKESLAGKVAARKKNDASSRSSRPTDDMVKILTAIVSAIDEEPTAIEHKMNNKLVRLDGVEIGQGRLVLVFRSLPLTATTRAATAAN